MYVRIVRFYITKLYKLHSEIFADESLLRYSLLY